MKRKTIPGWDGKSCRAPLGARGLKPVSPPCSSSITRRAPLGARGLKHAYDNKEGKGISRAPLGARGLKLA